MDKSDFSELFAMLPPTENPVQTSLNDVPVIVHEDHRWLLPIAHFAQQKNLLPKPCTLIVFDQHDDGIDPTCTAALHPSCTLKEIIELCRKPPIDPIKTPISVAHAEIDQHLHAWDNDWIKAGMELGIFSDAVIFGGWNCGGRDSSQLYTDKATGNQHSIKIVSLPRQALSFKGELSDWLRARECEPIWQILGWKSEGIFEPGLPKIMLSIDLDCFACSCHGQVFAWPDKIFKAEFLKPPNRLTEWTGKRFLHSLVDKAGVMAIAREAECTGGPEESEMILRRLDSHVFDGELFPHGLGPSLSPRHVSKKRGGNSRRRRPVLNCLRPHGDGGRNREEFNDSQS